LPAKIPGKSNRVAVKNKQNNNFKPSADDPEYPLALREEVESALRQVRQAEIASREDLLKQALRGKNARLNNWKRKTQPLPNYRRLLGLGAENERLESSYMDHEDYPLPKDYDHTIFIRKHFSSLAAEKEEEDEGEDDGPPSPFDCPDSRGPTEITTSDDDDHFDAEPSPSKKKFAKQIAEFRLDDRIGVGYEDDEMNAEITKVLARFKDSKYSRQKIHEYLAIILQIDVERVNARWARANGAGEPRRQHGTEYEEVMSSFRDLFCRRCLIFDCNLHGLQDDYPPDIQLELAIRLENSGYWKVSEDARISLFDKHDKLNYCLQLERIGGDPSNVSSRWQL